MVVTLGQRYNTGEKLKVYFLFVFSSYTGPVAMRKALQLGQQRRFIPYRLTADCVIYGCCCLMLLFLTCVACMKEGYGSPRDSRVTTSYIMRRTSTIKALAGWIEVVTCYSHSTPSYTVAFREKANDSVKVALSLLPTHFVAVGSSNYPTIP